MKKVFTHPTEAETGKKYWRSFEELVDTPDFQEKLAREFPRGAAELNTDGVSRRHFIRLMGASTALAGMGLAACRRPEKHLVPFTKSIEWTIPGKPLFYATSMPSRRGAIPLVVTTTDGRPTKIEGNPLYTPTGGGTDIFAQASILDLYDPDRSRFFLDRGATVDAKKFDEYLDSLVTEISGGGGGGLAFLVEPSTSPTRERLRAELMRKYPAAKWCIYDPLASAGADEASKVAFGAGIRVTPQLEKADVILALDSDFLGSEEGSPEIARAFAMRRRADNPEAAMNRLYVVENHFTVTGGMADHRLRCAASRIGSFAALLANQLGIAVDSMLLDAAKKGGDFTPGWIEELAKDLTKARGKSLVLAGTRQPAAVHLLVNAINSTLGNLGATLTGAQAAEGASITIGELVGEMSDNKITHLFILGGNPVYNAPADLPWAILQKAVPNVIRVGMYEDETTWELGENNKSNSICRWHVPATHYLEAWGDARTADGTHTSVQPMILPLYGGWSEIEILARLVGKPRPEGPELVKETFRGVAKAGGDFEAGWNKFLHDGLLSETPTASRTLFYSTSAGSAFLKENADFPAISTGDETLEVVLRADARTDDGRYANNGWLMETPDPVTKLTWDNAALISPKTAKGLGLSVKGITDMGVVKHEIVEISLDEKRRIEIPVLVAVGHADGSISIPLGYGRRVFSQGEKAGRVASGAGFNAYPLRTTTQPYFAVGAKVRKTGKTYELAITQDHWNMEGRAIVREGTLETFQKNPQFAQTMGLDEEKPKGGNPSLYSHPPLTAVNQWGMAIDLNTCTGCNACVVACQAENNIPIVGKEQVINGRQMQWIRLDRYFASEKTLNQAKGEYPEEPEMLMQPMLCQHCENAPCETVCPVNATVHSDDGLNVMAYNRCIGTRYCANNCPFKVRRFNFFDYHQRPLDKLKLGPLTQKGSPDTLKMQKNINVTVRMRGVMEKCTFCVQRIQEARIATKVRAGSESGDVRIPADSFQVACQQACPSDSIVFGDIKNPESKVAKLRSNGEGETNPRGYQLLDYLNVNTRIMYLARVRNPNTAMPGAEKMGVMEKPEGDDEHEPARGVEAHS